MEADPSLLRSQEKRAEQSRGQIDVLPDDILLGIFDFFVDVRSAWGSKTGTESWQLLVRVCRRWRSLVFESPRRLDLRLVCTPQTPVKKTLDVWPAFPLIIEGYITLSSGTDNFIVALELSNRVSKVDLVSLAKCQLERVLATMQVPFPELTDLRLIRGAQSAIPIPDSFLGGSAPSLRYFELDGIPFPGLPKPLLSSTRLVSLWLTNIPHSGYISPEAMVALLSVLSSLESLSLGFEYSKFPFDWQSRPPPERSILPALNKFHFKGVTGYLEDLFTRIDTPQLDEIHIMFFIQFDFNCPRLAQFIDRTPTLRTLDEAHLLLDDNHACVRLGYRTFHSGISDSRVHILRRGLGPDRQLSYAEQPCNSSLPPFCTVEDLYVEYASHLVWKIDAIGNTLWLQLLLPFTTVKKIYISRKFVPGIAAALRELVGGRITEVLPSLQHIFVEGLKESGPVPDNIGQFVAARQLSGHTITISDW